MASPSHSGASMRLATHATGHCLLGCALGELAGLLLGVALGLGAWPTMALATALGFVSGFTLGLWPLVKEGSTWSSALKTIWLGELISIGVMELVMNLADYSVGGIQTGSILSMRFWLGYALALPAGFVAAWPVNYWLLKRRIKKPCH